MLKRLTISNYALIRQLDIPFFSGFSTITGETGAGKSIMLDALGLVLGNRADTRVLWDKEIKCCVEATFLIGGYGLEPVFAALDLDYDDETLFRREINPAGKSRAFINDTPVQLHLLKDLGSRLINIHSQHEILVLNNREFQLAMLDSFAGHEADVVAYQQVFTAQKNKKAELEQLKSIHAEQLARFDYESFLFQELTDAHLDALDIVAIREEHQLLEHAEEIRNTLFQLFALFNEQPADFLSTLKTTSATLERIGAGTNLAGMIQRLQSLYLEAEDLARDIEAAKERVFVDPQQLEVLEDKINYLNQLLLKHRVNDLSELIGIRNEIDLRLQHQNLTSDAILRCEKELFLLEEEVLKKGRSLSARRREVVKPLSDHLTGILALLGMADAVIDFRLDEADHPMADGLDKVTLLFSANHGSAPDLISRIASGGELSRLMLAVKSVLSTRKLIPAIIFDEIDAGVSGEIAGKTGHLMRKMGETMQVIAITHLPQIASKGAWQYKASKGIEKGRTISEVRLLSADDRPYEIAKMLSDTEPTAESLANAKQLLASVPVKQS
jgi:DNA repair protein RecN (Recombination protein N)